MAATPTQEALANLDLPYNRAAALDTARSFRNYYTDIARRIEAGEEIWVDVNGECETTPARQAREAKVREFLTQGSRGPQTPPRQHSTKQHNNASYPLQSIACPTHGLRNTVARFHEQRGTAYADGSYDTRWHEVTACGCVFDVRYYHIHASPDALVADSATVVYGAAV
jgi:hypothetical protein